VDLQINSKSHVPVHVQLKGQLVHLILTGRLKVGSRLPSIRAMAGFLRINRNTVARVFSDLERDGFVESRRGSGVYVVEPPVAEEDLKRQRLLERVMDLASAQGVPVDEIGYALLARAGLQSQEKTRVLFVECNEPELGQFAAELEEQLPVEVERVLLEDLPWRVAEGQAEGDLPWRLAVTTFFHVHEVEAIVEPVGLETVALLAEATLESLQRLTELAPGTAVGVVGNSRTCTENLLRSFAGAGLDHLRFVEIRLDGGGQDDARTLLNGVEAAVCSSSMLPKLASLGIAGSDGEAGSVEIIEGDRTLDEGGIEMLGRLLRQPIPQ